MVWKRWLLRSFFVVQIILFVVFYFDSSFSLRGVDPIRAANASLEREIKRVHKQIDDLNQEMQAINDAPDVYYESVARKDLGMANKGDHVYVYDSGTFV
jgi:cell division protein FtsB